MSLFNADSSFIGFDISQSKIIAANKSECIIFQDVPEVAVSNLDGKPVAYGANAVKLCEQDSHTYKKVNPFEGGKITSFVYGKYLLGNILREICKMRNVVRPSIIVAVPLSITEVEEKAIVDIFLQSGAKQVFLLNNAVCSAIAISTTSLLPNGYLVVDIGYAITEIAVTSIGKLVSGHTLNTSGQVITNEIRDYMKYKYDLLLSYEEADNIKKELGSSNPLVSEIHKRIRVKNLKTNDMENFLVSSKDVEHAMDSSIREILDGIIRELKITSPELVSDIIDNGIFLVGGGSQIRNLDNEITHVTGVNTYVYKDTSKSVINGMIKILKNMSKYRDIISDKI